MIIKKLKNICKIGYIEEGEIGLYIVYFKI